MEEIPRSSEQYDYEFPDDYTLGQEEIVMITPKEKKQEEEKPEKPRRTQKKPEKKNAEEKKALEKRKNVRWVIRTFLLTLVLSSIFLIITEQVSEKGNLVLSLVLLVLLIMIGILFDMVGTATASADIEPFVSKAARKDKSAMMAIKILQNAEKVSSFCNDIVGDICGVVSGGCASSIVIILLNNFTLNNFVVSVALSACVSAMTVGGKAIGKTFSMKNSHEIIALVGKVASVFKK